MARQRSRKSLLGDAASNPSGRGPLCPLDVPDHDGTSNAETGSAECSWSNLGAAIMLPFAVVALATGTSLLVVGSRRIADWRRWQHAHRVTLRPTLRHAPRGLTVGLELRF